MLGNDGGNSVFILFGITVIVIVNIYISLIFH